jgi:Tol biopolymer transport system component
MNQRKPPTPGSLPVPAPAPRVGAWGSLVWALRPIALIATASLLGSAPLAAQTTTQVAQPGSEDWDVTLARGETRQVDFTTETGTWMSVDLAVDGEWIAFDLLGHVYRMAASGGEAEVLTGNSGVAVNFHPRISPDGSRIAFVSDRRGQNNLWVMGVDGSEPRPVFQDADVRVSDPAWTPDGAYILVVRQSIPRPGQPPSAGIWMYHVEGGEGVELVDGQDYPGAAWPSVSPDGRYMYFHVYTGGSQPSGWRDALKGHWQVRRFEFATGQVTEVTAGEAHQQLRQSSGSGYAAEVSPDGRSLAFARRIPGGRLEWKGHEFGPRTALWLRDLETGEERILMDPIELDMAEGMKTLRILPGYAWSADGRSIVISQGGRIRKLDVASGEVSTLPFTARVQRTVSEMAYAPFSIEDGPLAVRFLRWHTASPDGRRLAVQGVGRIWVSELPADGSGDAGTPQRLTPRDFEPLEYSPAWSPDGRWIAFSSWDDAERGHVWRVPAGGGAPQRLTEEPGEYVHPVWSPDGMGIVVARGPGITAHGRGLVHAPWYELVRIPAEGGPATPITRVTLPPGASFFAISRSQIVRPTFGPDGRIYFPQRIRHESAPGSGEVTGLVSVRADGSERRIHLIFPNADEIVPAPDLERVAFQEADNVYLVPFPAMGTGEHPVHIDKRQGKLPVTRLTTEGGLFPRWRNAGTLEFGSANRYFAHRPNTGQTDTVTVELSVPRNVPTGTIALTNARIVTLENREVVERGTLVVEGARIACVGECDTTGADRVVDATGTTIIPGFMDMHAHHYREHRGVIPSQNYESAIYLAYGVTTSLDNSMWSQDIFPTAEMIEAGLVVGPRTFSTGDPLYRGDGARQDEITSLEVARHSVNRLASWGAVSIKQYLQPRRDQRQWISHAARERGLMVTAEGDNLPYNISMILDGQTGFEHPMSYLPLYQDVARFFGQTSAVYSPTWVVGGPGPWNEEYFFAERSYWEDEKLRRWLPWRQLAPHTLRRMLRPDHHYSFPMIAQGLADIVEEGGYGAIGSHGQQHGIAPHWEVWMAASAMGAMGALEVASLHGAHFLGASDDLGSLAPGKLADLMVLNSNPLDDIRNTEDIRYVMKAGALYDADTLDEIWPRERPFGPRPWVDEDSLREDVRGTDWWDP